MNHCRAFFVSVLLLAVGCKSSDKGSVADATAAKAGANAASSYAELTYVDVNDVTCMQRCVLRNTAPKGTILVTIHVTPGADNIPQSKPVDRAFTIGAHGQFDIGCVKNRSNDNTWSYSITKVEYQSFPVP